MMGYKIQAQKGLCHFGGFTGSRTFHTNNPEARECFSVLVPYARLPLGFRATLIAGVFTMAIVRWWFCSMWTVSLLAQGLCFSNHTMEDTAVPPTFLGTTLEEENRTGITEYLSPNKTPQLYYTTRGFELITLPPFIIHTEIFYEPRNKPYSWDKQTSAEDYLTRYGLQVCSNSNTFSNDECYSLQSFQCGCDTACQAYGYCCHDRLTDLTAASYAGCLEYGMYAITKCPTSWGDDSIRRRCESQDGLYTRDEPVTDPTTNITFRNKFCAACHRVISLKAWELSVICKHFQYMYTADSQEVFMTMVKQNSDICSIGRVPPDGVNTPSCKESFFYRVIGECNVTGRWREEHYDEDLVINCNRYKSVILRVSDYVFIYQNLFCAICNGIIPFVQECGLNNHLEAPDDIFEFNFLPPLSLLLGLQDSEIQVENQDQLTCLKGQWLDVQVSE